MRNTLIPVMNGNDTVLANILVKDEKIAGFLADISGTDAAQVIDAKGMLTIPGCIDSHTYFMDPGFTHRKNDADFRVRPVHAVKGSCLQGYHFIRLLHLQD